MKQSERDVDLVVIGSGIAGQTTATAAAEAGLRVVLLEKMPTRGGSSAMSGGWFAISETQEQQDAGVTDSDELFLDDLLQVGEHRNDRALLEAYLANQRATFAWLKERGAVVREVAISSGMSAARGHNVPIVDLLDHLHDAYLAAGGRTLLQARATQLLRDASGRVTGVDVETPDGATRVTARRGVVLATGGFSRSAELLSVFAPEQLAALPYGGRGNTGDGLRMGWKLGAGMADMSTVSGTYGSHPETGEEFHELLTAYYMGAIIVNLDGHRFADESSDYKTLGRLVLDEPDGIGVQIFDATVRALSHPGIPLKDIDKLEEIGHVHRADTLEELAGIVGIDAEALVATVERYNAAIAGRAEDEVGRTALVAGQGDLLPIVKPPFYAYPAMSLMTTTYCGLTIDPHGRVLDVDRDVIDGLYAVGEVTGGFHGAAYMTGTSLGKGAVFGRIVAEHVAREEGSA